MDSSLLSSKSPLTLDEMEGIFLHENGHVKNRDVEHLSALGQWAGTYQMLSDLAGFYRDEPDKFAALVKKNFGDAAHFSALVSTIAGNAKEGMASVFSNPAINTADDIKMVKLLYKDAKASEAILSITPPTHDTFAQSVELSMAFHNQSAKQRDLMKKIIEAQHGDRAPEILAMLIPKQEQIPHPIDQTTRQALDTIDKTILQPAITDGLRLAKITGHYSRAAEFRADDIAVTLSDHPQVYAGSIRKIIKHAVDNAVVMPESIVQMQKEAADGKPQILSHPDMELRELRARKLLKRINTMQETCGEVDIPTAIAGVNKEMLTIAKPRGIRSVG